MKLFQHARLWLAAGLLLAGLARADAPLVLMTDFGLRTARCRQCAASPTRWTPS